jgi:hypothetical protein
MTLDAAKTILGFFGFDRLFTAVLKGIMMEVACRIKRTESKRHRN